MDAELPLAEFADLEKVPLPPKPKYRCKVDFKVRFTDYVEFETDDDPNEWLEDEDNTEGPLDYIIEWGRQNDWDFYPGWGKVEVSHDDGKTWEEYRG